MFLGTGAVYVATAYCQDVLHRAGLVGNAAIIATFLRSLLDGVVRGATRAPYESMIRSHELRVVADGIEKFAPSGLLFLATTLDRLVLRARPFWGGRTAPIRATAIPHPLPGLARWLLPALYGPEDRRMPEGAISFCASSLSIASSTPFVMDGEFFKPPQNTPLHVETGPDFIYISG